MELIREITDKDLKLGNDSYFGNKYKIRKASRIVIFNEDKNIALIDVSKRGYHKLPGGGQEEGEDVFEALKREVLEEVGCHIEIGGEIGMIIEHKNDYFQIQFSYCYLGKVVGDIGEPNYTDSEIEKGMKIMWVSVEKAISLMVEDMPKDYTDKFILERDLSFLRYLKIIFNFVILLIYKIDLSFNFFSY